MEEQNLEKNTNKEGYQNYLVIASKEDSAGVNITTQLSKFTSSLKENDINLDFYLSDKDILKEEFLDLEKINKYDFIIFASKHSSEKKEKTLAVHSPGNWRQANPSSGGKSWKVSKASALFNKSIFEKLNEKTKENHLEDKYKITLEATHHGPLIDKPCVFIEIGSSEEEWKDKKAGFNIAQTIYETLRIFKKNPYREITIGIGGPHYCPNFNKIQLNSNLAVSHIIPSYSLPLKEEMLREALEKTDEEIDLVLLDWKGIKSSEQRQRIIEILNKNYINYKKTKDVQK